MTRTDLSRLSELASTDRSSLDRLLDEVQVGHFAVTGPTGDPVVLPTAIVRDGDGILAHGSTGSGWMRLLANGAPTALAVTAVDGLVVARSAFESSMQYRSAVVFGCCTVVSDPAEKRAALDVITEGLLPGRVDEVRAPTAKELAATLVLRLPIEEWSLKISDGFAEDPDSDVAGPAWAGVVPIRQVYGAPLPSPDLRPGVAIPDSVGRLG